MCRVSTGVRACVCMRAEHWGSMHFVRLPYRNRMQFIRFIWHAAKAQVFFALHISLSPIFRVTKHYFGWKCAVHIHDTHKHARARLLSRTHIPISHSKPRSLVTRLPCEYLSFQVVFNQKRSQNGPLFYKRHIMHFGNEKLSTSLCSSYWCSASLPLCLFGCGL